MTRAAFAFCLVVIAAVSSADARCSRTTYRGFVRDFEHTRSSMRSQPARARSSFEDLSRRAAVCEQGETNKETRFKLVLFQTGLRGYLGAADAQLGRVAQGNAEAQSALADAQRLVNENRSNRLYQQLAQELIAQLRTPLEIIQEKTGAPPEPSPR